MDNRILVLGYGNPGRQDDGLGPALAEAVESCAYQNVSVDSDYQLNIEDAADIAKYSRVLFIDASISAQEPYEAYRIQPGAEIAFTSHTLSPESLLAIADEHFGNCPEAWVVGVRGYHFNFVEELSPEAQCNMNKTLPYIQRMIEAWKEQL